MKLWRRKTVTYLTALAFFHGSIGTALALPLASLRAPERPALQTEGPAPTEAADYRLAFDGRADTAFASPQKTVIDYPLDARQSIQSLRLLDAAPFVLSVDYWDGRAWVRSADWTGLDLTQLPAGWTGFELRRAIDTDRLRLILEPRASASTGLKEVEFWTADGADSLVSGVAGTTQALAAAGTLPGQFRGYPASLSEGWIGTWPEQPSDNPADNQFTVALDLAPTAIKRAWLSYEVYGVQDHAAVSRSINDQLAVGGYLIQKSTAWSPQKEAINPAWLRSGDNTIRFTLPDNAPYGYRIRNLALVVEKHTGTQVLAALRSTGPASALADRLFDGQTHTHITLAQLQGAAAPAAVPATSPTTTAAPAPRGPLDTLASRLQAGQTIAGSTLSDGRVYAGVGSAAGQPPAQADSAWTRTRHSGNELLPGCQEAYCQEVLAEGTVEASLDDWTVLEQASLFTAGNGLAHVEVQALTATGWVAVGASQRLNAGWNSIAFAGQPAVKALRLRFDRLPSQTSLGELRLQGHAVRGTVARDLILSSPAAGQYYSDKAYLKGFIAGHGASAAQLMVGSQKIKTTNGEFEVLVRKPAGAGSSWSVGVTAIFSDGQVIRQNVVLSHPQALDFERALKPAGTTQSTPVSGAQPQIVTAEGASLEIDKGAVQNKTLTITPLRDVDLPALGAGMINVTKTHQGYRFLPHGRFEKKIKVRIGYDKTKLPAGYTEADIKTYFFDDATGRWVPLETADIDIAKTEVVAYTDHFTDMINAVLQVPDNPETQSYTPTQLKDIKAADPGAGINLIEVPEASAMGDANLGYPIQLPPGRQGVQPNLRIGYSSGAGNGWLGLGWNLSLPSVGIDTRWGVPRYSATQETETYVLNGEQLTPLAHREALQPRVANRADFHTRVEGAFQRIKRHGDSPSNYWWEVTAKDGTTSFYGGLPNQGLQTAAVLTDGSGHVAHWALTEQRDTNGNFVRYHYAKIQDAGVGNGQGGVPGYQLYIQKITYTGHNATEGAYSVEFQRDRDLGETRRADVSIDARLGFKQVTADLLRKVQVKFKNQAVRSYELVYTQGAFAKTLLKEVKQFGADGSLFNTHGFEYFDEVRNANGQYQPYAGSEAWTVPNDSVVNNKVRTRGDLHNRASAMSGTASTSKAGIHLTASIGILDQLQCKSSTIGGSYDTHKSNSEGLLAMVDINGDGLPDKVMKSGGSLVYRLNESGADGGRTFKSGSKGPIGGIQDFYKDKTSGRTVGVEGVLGCTNGTVSLGISRGKSTSESQVYFTDANGDGLMDIANNGAVYFNHLNAQGHPVFTLNSGDTPNPLGASEAIDEAGLVVSNPQELEEAITQHPLHDLVRMWEAPFNGQVKITAPVALIQDTSTERQEDTQADGVRVAIQHKGTELWATSIAANDYTAKTPANVSSITVAKGDRLYFRAQSVFNGAWDQVNWNPVVEYVGSTALNDANQKPHFRFTAGDDFVLTAPAGQALTAPLAGTLQLEGTFTKPITSDEVRVKVLHNNQVVWQQILPAAQAANVPLSLPLTVNALDKLRFIVEADTTIAWPTLQWVPHIYYTASNDPNLTLRDEDGNYILEFYPQPELTLYSGVINPVTQAWTAPATSGFTFEPQLGFSDALDADGMVTFTVKRNGQLLGKQTLTVLDGVIQDDPATLAIPRISVAAQQNDALWVEYHTSSNALRNRLLTAEAKRLLSPTPQIFNTGFYAARDDAHFGPLYRGWGHFAYNGNRERATAPINESELRVDNLPTPNVDFSGVNDEASLENKFAQDGYDPAKAKFIPMFADMRQQQWIGFDNLTWLKAADQSSSRLGADDFSEPGAVPFVGARAVTKLTKTTDTSFSLAGGSGAVNGSLSTTRGQVRSVVDFMDMNGDRYPDIVGESQVQYTNMLGGLQGAAIANGLQAVRYVESSATSASLGGSAGKVEPKKVGVGTKMSIEIGSSAPAFGISGSYGTSKDKEQYSWVDINGDGLPDRVYQDGGVALNLGYRFAAKEAWGFNATRDGQSDNTGANLGFNIGAMSIAGGLSLTKANNQVLRTLFDVNGDGLLDDVQVQEGQPLRVALNTGNGFTDALNWNGVSAINRGSSTSMGGGVYVTFCIEIRVLGIKICGNPGFNRHDGISREEQSLTDIDGDGYPDILASDRDSQLTVSHSTIGRTNLLKKVSRPLGATVALDYQRVGNTYEMPQSRWVMDKVEVTDGVTGDGPDRQLMTFQYKDGFYDRRERDFYGFKTVIAESRDTAANDALYRAVTRIFSNDNYYEKGLLLSERMTDAAGKPFTQTTNTYALKDIDSGNLLTGTAKQSVTATAFPQLTETVKTFFEGGSQSKSTRLSYAYDALGNVTKYSDFGDVGTADDLIATLSYHALNNLYVMSEPASIVVSNAAGELLRRRESTLDASANLTELRRYLGNGSAITHNFTYHPNGNVQTVQRPANASGQRYTLTYAYDPDVATHVAAVSDSFGYVSQADYDLRWGAVTESRDLNAQKIQSTFDPFGRLETITGPYEQGQATLRFAYHPEGSIPWALTQHHDEGRADPLETVLFTDGLKRVLQTKKDGAVDATGGGSASDVMIVSGRVTFDAFGRTVAQFHPVTEGLGAQGTFNASFDGVQPTRTEFDVLDREVQTTLPDNSVFRTSYDFGNDRDGLLQFRTTATDASGVKKERFTDVRGRQTALLEHNVKGGQANLWTSYRYNAINELVQVKDDKNNLTSADYDLLGRRTALQSPDAGREERVYDAASSLVQRITSNLRDKGVAIHYDYDFERLAATRYPLYPDNNVRYHYGAANATDNRVGRLAKVEDASGVEEFFYGPLGETTQTVRTLISLTGRGAKTYTTQFRYDTWNRIRELTYPDGEVLTYGYNAGGLLKSISGRKGNDSYAYLNNLSYDKFEQRVFQALGNGTTMTYAYELERRRLATLTSRNTQRQFMDVAYTYDAMTNITALQNRAPAGTSPDAFGGPTQQTFAYDDLYRLTNANGHWTNWQGHQERYALNLKYDTIHNLTKKTQTHERRPNGDVQGCTSVAGAGCAGATSNWLPEKKTSYDWAYAYTSNKPHAATHIGERSFGYDANGNQLGWDHDKNGQRRGIVWDEENRIRSLSDNGRTQTYLYDANGERVLKRGRQGETAYVNGYFVIRNGAVASKHVFNGSQRLATKLVMQEPTTIPDPNGNGNNNGVGNGNTPPGWIKHGKTSNPGANFPSAQDRTQQLQTATAYDGNISGGTVYEAKQYFYHPDHVGSTGYVTDANGAVFEHLEYFAFGETWVQEHSNTERTPYLFTGKELDEETQLYYFGARYYDPRTSQWQSTDPILDDYFNNKDVNALPQKLALFNYGKQNPLLYVDPDGRDDYVFYYKVEDRAFERAAKTYGSENSNGRKVNYIGISTETDFKKSWGNIAQSGQKVDNVAVFSHGDMSLGGTGTLEFRPDNANDGTLSGDEIKSLPKLNYSAKDSIIDLRTCRGGMGLEPAAQSFANSQGRAALGQKGYATFSESPDVSIGINKSSEKVYLRAFDKGQNNPLNSLLPIEKRALPIRLFRPEKKD
ncbi:MAG: SpvB/TcaC N-terminal domain-containing protein [Pseudomonadota bacterium]